MQRYEGISRWAAPHVEHEFDDDMNRPRQPSPFMARVLEHHDEALLRKKQHRRDGWRFVLRAAGAFALTCIPWMPSWLSVIFFWASVAFGVAACFEYYKYRCASIESTLWPEDLPTVLD